MLKGKVSICEVIRRAGDESIEVKFREEEGLQRSLELLPTIVRRRRWRGLRERLTSWFFAAGRGVQGCTATLYRKMS